MLIFHHLHFCNCGWNIFSSLPPAQIWVFWLQGIFIYIKNTYIYICIYIYFFFPQSSLCVVYLLAASPGPLSRDIFSSCYINGSIFWRSSFFWMSFFVVLWLILAISWLSCPSMCSKPFPWLSAPCPRDVNFQLIHYWVPNFFIPKYFYYRLS